jgi:hypothetical protein
MMVATPLKWAVQFTIFIHKIKFKFRFSFWRVLFALLILFATLGCAGAAYYGHDTASGFGAAMGVVMIFVVIFVVLLEVQFNSRFIDRPHFTMDEWEALEEMMQHIGGIADRHINHEESLVMDLDYASLYTDTLRIMDMRPDPGFGVVDTFLRPNPFIDKPMSFVVWRKIQIKKIINAQESAVIGSGSDSDVDSLLRSLTDIYLPTR